MSLQPAEDLNVVTWNVRSVVDTECIMAASKTQGGQKED